MRCGWATLQSSDWISSFGVSFLVPVHGIFYKIVDYDEYIWVSLSATNISILLYSICKTNIFPWYTTTKQKRRYRTLKGRKNASYIGSKKTYSRGQRIKWSIWNQCLHGVGCILERGAASRCATVLKSRTGSQSTFKVFQHASNQQSVQIMQCQDHISIQW